MYCYTSKHWKKGRYLNLAIFAMQTSPNVQNTMWCNIDTQCSSQSKALTCVLGHMAHLKQKALRKWTQLMAITKCSKAAPALIFLAHRHGRSCLMLKQIVSTRWHLIVICFLLLRLQKLYLPIHQRSVVAAHSSKYSTFSNDVEAWKHSMWYSLLYATTLQIAKLNKHKSIRIHWN